MGWTMIDVVNRMRQSGATIDTGNLSRIERGIQKPTPFIAEKLCALFGGEINEIHIIYPERVQQK